MKDYKLIHWIFILKDYGIKQFSLLSIIIYSYMTHKNAIIYEFVQETEVYMASV